MPDLMMLVDTAVIVPVNILPLLDDTDFKSREVAVAYDAAGMDLVWNFVTAAGVCTQTAVTPTTAGNYDWTHLGDGMYTIEIPASGGVSINNDTEGFGWFTGLVTGVLPWRGPIIQFSPANVVNALVPGSDYLQTHAVEITDGLITAAAIAANAIDADAIAADAGTEIANAILDLTAGVETNLTLRQFCRLVASVLLSEVSGGGTTEMTFRDFGNTKNRIVVTVTADGNRTAFTTRDAT